MGYRLASLLATTLLVEGCGPIKLVDRRRKHILDSDDSVATVIGALPPEKPSSDSASDPSQTPKSGTDPASPDPAPTPPPAPVDPNPPSPPKSLDEKKALAKAILDKHCTACHNSGNALGNFGSLDDLSRLLLEGKYIEPGSAEKSLLIKVMRPGGAMPPTGLIKKDDIDIVADWINSIPIEQFTLIDIKDLFEAILRDAMTNVPVTDRTSTRYFSFHSIPAASQSGPTLKIYQLALAKALNSISSAPSIVNPVKVDKQGLLYRINLRDLGVKTQTFDKFVGDFYPFGLAVAKDLTIEKAAIVSQVVNETIRLLGTAQPLIRGDWFTATFALPVPYETFMELGSSRLDLDRRLGINVNDNIREKQVWRSGFRDSGVAQHNRMIERHTQANGRAYWISYDFAESENAQSIFLNPLGPSTVFETKVFEHDGGEIIWQLPNGLFGFYLALANGNKIHKGPLSIVSQPSGGHSQFFTAIVNAISCMSCHDIGIIKKRDEIRDYVTSQIPGMFTERELNLVRDLYPAWSETDQKIDADNAAYVQALKELGLDSRRNANLPDVINSVFELYNLNLTRSVVAKELGITDEVLSHLIQLEPFKNKWLSLQRSDGSIKRSEFNALFPEAIGLKRPGVQFIPPKRGDYVVTAACMVADALDMSACLQISEPK